MRCFEDVPGCADIDARMSDLDTEGTHKEIVFANGLNLFLGYPDLEVRETVFRIYNQYLADLAALAPGRFYGVGHINYWDPEKVTESLVELKELGLKRFLMPLSPKGADGEPLNYCDAAMDYLWEAIEQADIPFRFHVGEKFS